jgi:o-succinylbenzoate synthase
MTIRTIQWHPYRVPLLTHFGTAHQQLATREGVIVEIYVDDGIVGVGEIAPLPEFIGDTVQDILPFLPHVAEQVQNKSLPEALSILHDDFNTIPGSARYGIETALLDAQGQSEGRSLSSILAQSRSGNGQVIRSEIAVNTVIGTMGVDATVELAQEAIVAGFRCIKLKMGRELEVEVARVGAVRAAVGPSIDLRLDANEGWTREQTESILTRCADFNIQYVEQPLSRNDLEGMRALRQTVSIPIAADEMLSDLASARRILEAGAADIFIIKPQLSGGLYNAQRMLQLASEHGLRSVITSSIEAGIGVAAALHLAASSPEVTLACGLGTLPMLKNDLISGALPIYNGTLQVPDGPGLGVALDRETLAKFSTISQRGLK